MNPEGNQLRIQIFPGIFIRMWSFFNEKKPRQKILKQWIRMIVIFMDNSEFSKLFVRLLCCLQTKTGWDSAGSPRPRRVRSRGEPDTPEIGYPPGRQVWYPREINLYSIPERVKHAESAGVWYPANQATQIQRGVGPWIRAPGYSPRGLSDSGGRFSQSNAICTF